MKVAATMLSAILLAAALGAAEADARGRNVAATAHTQRGTFTGQSRVERGPGFRNRDAAVTGPNGRQGSVHDERRWSRQEGTYNHDRVREFANGDTRAVDTDAQRTAPGEWSYQREVTGRNGETRSQNGEIIVERTP